MAVKDLNSKVDISSYNSKMNEINETFTKSQVTSGDIHQLQKNNKNIYPKTTTGAVYEGTKTLSSILEDSIFSEPHNNESVLVPDPSIVQKVTALENKFEEYLPLTGGIISGRLNVGTELTNNDYALDIPIGKIRCKGAIESSDFYVEKSETKAYFTVGNSGVQIHNFGKGVLHLTNDSKLKFTNSNVLWEVFHEGNFNPNNKRDNVKPVSGAWFDGTPVITADGVMEIGRIVDFHVANKATSDYDLRLIADPNSLVVVGNIVPDVDGSWGVGTGGRRWNSIWSKNGSIQTSDERYKTKIQNAQELDCFEMVKNVNVYTYTVINKDKTKINAEELEFLCKTAENESDASTQLGIMAQDLLPFDCSKYIITHDVIDQEDGETEDIYGINPYNLTSAVMAALKVEITKREQLENEVKELKDELKEIKNLLNSNK